MNEALLKKLYEKYGLSKKGTFEEFSVDMQNPEVQRKFFDKYGLGNTGKFENFQADLGIQEQQEEIVTGPQDTGITGAVGSMIDAAQTPSEIDPSSRVEPFSNSWKRGINLSETADLISFDNGTRNGAQSPDQLEEIARLQKEQQSIPISKPYQEFVNAKGLGDQLRLLVNPAKAPQIIGDVFLESLAGQAGNWEGIAGRAAQGGATGAAFGTAVMPSIGTAAGMGAGISAGAVTGMAETSVRLEWAGKFLEVLQEAGVDTTDPVALQEGFSNEELMAKASKLADLKAWPIGLFDLISGGLAGRLVSTPAKSLVGKLGQGLGEFATQAVAGGTGEFTGQKMSGEETDTASILLEMIGEGATAPVEITAGAYAYNQTKFEDPAIADAQQDIESSGDPELDSNIDAFYTKIASQLDELDLNPSVTVDDINRLAEGIDSGTEPFSDVNEENELADKEYTSQEATGIQATNLPPQSTQELNLDDSEQTPAIEKITAFENQESERQEFENRYTAEELAQMSEEDAAPSQVRKNKGIYEANQEKIKALETKKEEKRALGDKTDEQRLIDKDYDTIGIQDIYDVVTDKYYGDNPLAAEDLTAEQLAKAFKGDPKAMKEVTNTIGDQLTEGERRSRDIYALMKKVAAGLSNEYLTTHAAYGRKLLSDIFSPLTDEKIASRGLTIDAEILRRLIAEGTIESVVVEKKAEQSTKPTTPTKNTRTNIVQEEGRTLQRVGNTNYFKEDPTDMWAKSKLRDSVQEVDIDELTITETTSEAKLSKMGEYTSPTYTEYSTDFPIAIKLGKDLILLDGHHRVELAKRKGEKKIRVAIKDVTNTYIEDKPTKKRAKPQIDPEERKKDLIVKYKAQLENIKKDKPGKQVKRLQILNENTLEFPEVNADVQKQLEYLKALTEDKAFDSAIRNHSTDEKLDLIASRAGDDSKEAALIGQIKARVAQEAPKDGTAAIAALNELDALVEELKKGKLLRTELSEIERIIRAKTRALEPIAKEQLEVQKAEEEAAKTEKRTKQNDKDSHLVAIAKATLVGNPVGIKQAIDDYLTWRKEQNLATADKSGRPIDTAFVTKQAAAEIYVDKAEKQIKREAEEAAAKRRQEAKEKGDQKKRVRTKSEQRRLDDLKKELGLSDETEVDEIISPVFNADDIGDSAAEDLDNVTNVEKITIDKLFEFIAVAYPGRNKFMSGLKALYLAANVMTKHFTNGRGIEIYLGTFPKIFINNTNYKVAGVHLVDGKTKRDIIVIGRLSESNNAGEGITGAHELIHSIVTGLMRAMQISAKLQNKNLKASAAYSQLHRSIETLLSSLNGSIYDSYIKIQRKFIRKQELTQQEVALLSLVSSYINTSREPVNVYSVEGIGELIDDINKDEPLLHYFLYNVNELLAESFSNPYAAGILSILKSPYVETKGVEQSYFRQIYNSFVNFVENVLKAFDFKPVKNSYFDQLSNYMETLEKAYFKDTTEIIDLYDIKLPFDMSNAMLSEKHAMIKAQNSNVNPMTPALRKLINYLANSWYRRKDIVSLEGVEKELEKINRISTKNKFTQPEATLLWRKIQKYRQKVQDAKNSQANALAYAKTHIPEYLTSRTFRRDINDFADVDLDQLTIAQVALIEEGIIKLAMGSTPRNVTFNLVNKDVAVKKLNKLLEFAGKYGKNPGIYIPVKVSIANLTNPATYSSILAKYNTKAANAIFKEIFWGLINARTHTLHETNYFTKGMFEIVNKRKLGHTDFVKAGMYGAIFSTQLSPTNPDYWLEVELNAARVIENAKNKIKAYERGAYRGTISEKEMSNEVKIAQDLYNVVMASKTMDSILTTGQQELYDELRSFSTHYEKDMQRNTEGVWGADFTKQFNYFPTYALGKVRGGRQKGADDLIADDDANNLWEGLRKKNDYGKILGRQSGRTKEKVQPTDYFYDYDIMSISSKFAPSTLFDLYASRELKILNQLINGAAGKPASSNKKTIDNVFSSSDPIILGLNTQIKSIVGGVVSYDEGLTRAFKFLSNAKNSTAVALLGTTGQFLVQTSSAVPAAMIMSSKGFPRALALVTGIERGESYSALKEALDKMREKGASITVRDILFERFQTIEDINKAGLARGLSGWRGIAEEVTTAMLRAGDKGAARLVWFSEYFATGGTLENPTEKAIIAAERAVGMLQNMSDVAFSAPFLRTNSQAARILLQMLYAFQSFALNNAFNLLYSTKYALNSGEARRVMLSSLMMAAAYSAVTVYVIRPVYSATADALFGSDDDYEEEKNFTKTDEFLWGTAWDLLVGQWAPTVVEGLLKEKVVKPIIKKRVEEEGGKFDQFKDIPIYMPKNEAEVMSEAVGIYGDVISGGINLGAMLYQSMDNLASGEELDMNQVTLDGIRTVLLFERAIPMRGDMQKLLRNYQRRVAQEENAMKKNKSGSPVEMEEVGTEFELPEYDIEIPEDPTELPEL